MFRITGLSGFHVKFKSGYMVSVQFGPGNYGSNYDLPYSPVRRLTEVPPAETAEIAVFSPDRVMLELDNDQVDGYKNADFVLEVMRIASEAMSDEWFTTAYRNLLKEQPGQE
jgi:hypothetical protein